MTADRRLRVVHVITSLGAGGAEKQVEFLARDARHETEVVCLYSSGLVGEAIAAAGTPVSVLGMDGWRKAAATARLARLLRSRRPDVVHVHLLSAQLWGLPAARLAGCPVIVSSEHSLMTDTIEGRRLSAPLRVVYRILAAAAHRTIAVSDATADRLRRLGVRASRIVVIENGIDLEAVGFSPSGRDEFRAQIGVAPGTVLVGAVARLAPVKRLDVLIDALAGALAPGVVELVIAGDGPLREELLARATATGVEDAVHLVGTRASLGPLLSAFDVFVSPSHDETFGMAIVEAAANGLPLVFGECPALDELPGPWPGAVRLPTGATRETETSVIRSAVAAIQPDHPRPAVAPTLAARFGTDVLRDAVHALYLEVLDPLVSGILPRPE